MKIFIGIVLLILSLTIFTVVIVKGVKLKQNCTGYLTRAANANTTDIALVELEKAIKYLETNNLTEGYTSVLWKTPDEDIEFWYNNIKASYDELLKINDATSSLEKSNVLMKLRETLMESGEKGDNLTVPDGLSRYPNNGMWGILLWLSIIFIVVIIPYISITFDEY